MYKVLIEITSGIKLILFGVLFLLFNTSVQAATFEQIEGLFAGTITGTDTNIPGVVCPTNGLSSTVDLLVEFSNQSGANFDAKISGTNLNDGDAFEATGTGSLGGGGSILFAVIEPDGTTTTFSPTTINSTVFSFTVISTGTLCKFTATGSLSRVSGDLVVNPAITASSTVTEVVLFNTQIQSTISDVSSHIFGALSGIAFFGGPQFSDNQFKVGGATGLNAGDGLAIPYGVWGSYSYTNYENDLSSTAFDGANHGFLGGIDFSFWDNTVLGVAFGYDSGDIDTTFNLGNQKTDAFTIAPYFGALLTDSLSLDFTAGYSRVDYDQFRTLAATRITSSPTADRWFGAFNLNAITFYDKWVIGGRIGASYASSQIDSYTESNGTVVADSRTKLSTVSLAGDVAYSYGDYEPFVNLSYQNDFQLKTITVTTGPQPSNDTDDMLMTTGVRYFSKNGITGNFEYSKRFFRDNLDEDRISMTIRADF